MAIPKPPKPAKPAKPTKPIPSPVSYDPFARALAAAVRQAHGVDQAATLDMSEEIGAPRGYIGTRNIALDRALSTTGIPLGRITEISGWPGSGKALPVTAPVLTPGGFVRMGAIRVGDLVIGQDGQAHAVTAVFPQGVLPVFRVVASDGATVECCDDHLWLTQTRNEARNAGAVWTPKPLSAIRSSLVRGDGSSSPNHRLPVLAPVVFRCGPSLPLDPYLLGLLLGDGGLTDRTARFTKPEPDVIAKLIACLPAGDAVTAIPSGVRIRSASRTKASQTWKALIGLRLAGTYSSVRFIPRDYLYGSVDERLALLRGLCDTDGSVCVNGTKGKQIEYGTSSERLAYDVAMLARSLGASVYVSSRMPWYTYKGTRHSGQPAWRVRITMRSGAVPVSSAKHLARWADDGHHFHQSIVSVEPAGVARCQCITVEGGTYVTQDFLVTHNSTMLDQILAQCQAEGGVGVLADTERTRNRAYMAALGCVPESMVWIAGMSIELMFDEIETLVRKIADMNALAWWQALERAGVKVAAPQTYRHEVYDPATHHDKQRKPVAVFVFAKWGREQAGGLLEYQQSHGLRATSVRDQASREALRPVVAYTEPADTADAIATYFRDGGHPLVQPADRPVVIGWDSVAGTPTEEELAGDARDQHVATAAKVIRRNLRRLVQVIDNEAIAFVLVNQRYERINTGRTFMRGPTSETYGGGGIKYHTTIRIEVDKIGDIFQPGSKPEESPPMGQIVRIRVPKNKVGDPFREETFGLIFGRGADNAWAIYNDLKERGIVRSAGGWSRFADPGVLGDGDRSFRGWQELSNMMASDRDLWQRLTALYHEGRL